MKAAAAATPAVSHDEAIANAVPHVEPTEHEEHEEHEEPAEPESQSVAASEHAFIDEKLTHEPEEHHEHAEESTHDGPAERADLDLHEDKQEVEVEARPIAHEEPEHKLDEPEVAALVSENDMDEQPTSPSPMKAATGDDLEDLIFMLEAKNAPRPSLPVIAGEIPDEE